MPPVTELLRKLSERTITPEEEVYLFRWLNDHREEWILEMYEAYWQAAGEKKGALTDERSDQLRKAIYDKIGVTQTNGENGRLVRPKWRWRYAGAAAVLLTLLAGGLGYFGASLEVPEVRLSGELQKEPLRQERNNTGKDIAPLVLPDGSSVWLYPKSRLLFPTVFKGGERRVTLEGKAFFEVAKNREKPFVVVSEELETVVLGTSFVVDAYHEKPSFKIAVRTGKVSVRTRFPGKDAGVTGPAIALHAREHVIFNRETSRFISPNLPEPGDTTTYREVRPDYRFRETPVTEILAVLEKDYGIPIFVDAKALESCALTTTLTERTFFEKLRIISEAVGPGTSFTLEGESVVFHSPGCNN